MIFTSKSPLYSALLVIAATVFASIPAQAETYHGTWATKSDPVGNVYFASPTTLATDRSGQILVTDLGNNRIVRFNMQDATSTSAVNFTGKLGHSGNGKGEFNIPFGVAVDKRGFTIVTDAANYRVQIFNPAGNVVKTWGTRGTGNGQFELPREIAIDSKNNIFITDEFNHRVQVFNKNGKYLYQFGSYGTDPGQFRLPQGIIIDSNDRVIVADTFNHRIQVLDSHGTFISQLGSTLVCADSGVYFCFPRGVTLDAADNLFVADTFNHKVKKYDAAFNYLYSAGGYPQPLFPNAVRAGENGTFFVTDTGNSQVIRYTENATATGATLTNVIGAPRTADGQFNQPAGIMFGKDSRVYVSDKLNHRIQVFDKKGNFLAKWGKNAGAGGFANAGYLPGEFHQPSQIATDAQGRVYVADSFNSRVQVLNSSGQWLATIGGYGFADGQFYLPTGVTTDLAGNVFVVDWGVGKISKFDANFNFVRSWGTYGPGDGQFNRPNEIATDASGYVYVIDARNARVQKFDNNGTFITKWGTHGGVATPTFDVLLNMGGGNGDMYFPQGISVVGNTVYVSDTSNSRMQKFDLNGQYLGQWGKFSSQKGDFFNPSSIAISPQGHEYIVDLLLHRVQTFAP